MHGPCGLAGLPGELTVTPRRVVFTSGVIGFRTRRSVAIEAVVCVGGGGGGRATRERFVPTARSPSHSPAARCATPPPRACWATPSSRSPSSTTRRCVGGGEGRGQWHRQAADPCLAETMVRAILPCLPRPPTPPLLLQVRAAAATAKKAAAPAPATAAPRPFGAEFDLDFGGPPAPAVAAPAMPGPLPRPPAAAPAVLVSVKDAFDDLVDVCGSSHDATPPPPQGGGGGGGSASAAAPPGGASAKKAAPAAPAAAAAARMPAGAQSASPALGLGLADLSEEDARVLVSSGEGRGEGGGA